MVSGVFFSIYLFFFFFFLLFHASCLCIHSKYWAEKLYGASASKSNGNLGRIVGDSQMKRLMGVLKNHGGKVVVGGKYDEKERYPPFFFFFCIIIFYFF